MPRRGDRGYVEMRMTVDAATARRLQERVREVFGMNMWGYPHCDMTFQEACARNDPGDMTVSAPERRAVALLRQLCDPERVGRYLATGVLYARGNITGTVFCLVRVSPKVLELDHRGKVAATWCIHANKRGWNPESYGSGNNVPITDEVIVLKNLIEGEEAMFRLTGNRTVYRPGPNVHDFGARGFGFGPPDYVSRAGTPDYKARGVCDPHKIDFMGGMEPQIDPKIIAMAKQKWALKQQRNMQEYQAMPVPWDDQGLGEYAEPMFADQIGINEMGINPEFTAEQALEVMQDAQGLIWEGREGAPMYVNGRPVLGTGKIGTRSISKLDAEAIIKCDPHYMFKPFENAVRADEQWERQVEKAKARIEVSIL